MCFWTTSAFRKLRMRNQIIIIDGTILIILIIILVSAIHFQIAIFNLIQEETSSVILKKTEQRQISLATFLVSRQVSHKHQRGIKVKDKIGIYILDHIAQFVIFREKYINKIYLSKSLEKYLQHVPDSQIGQILQFYFQENGKSQEIFLPKSNDGVVLMFSTFQLLNEYGLLIDTPSSGLLQVVDTQNAKFDFTFSVGIPILDYDYTTRPWYQNHLKQMQLHSNQFYFFSPVYKGAVVDFDYQFAITYSIFNEHKQFIAIAKLTFSIIDPVYKFILYNVLLINGDGQVLYNGLESLSLSKVGFYIYDQNITGFNYSDWQLIEKNSLQQSIISFQGVQDVLYLYNKFYRSVVHVQSKKFVEANLTLIVFTNVSSIQELEIQLSKIADIALVWRIYSCVIIFGVGTFSLLISLIYIHFFCKPLVNVAYDVKRYILSLGNNIHNEIFRMVSQYHSRNNVIGTLNCKFIKIHNILSSHNKNKKSEICRLVEKMKYSSRESTLNINPIKDKVKWFAETSNFSHNAVFDIIKIGVSYSREDINKF